MYRLYVQKTMLGKRNIRIICTFRFTSLNTQTKHELIHNPQLVKADGHPLGVPRFCQGFLPIKGEFFLVFAHGVRLGMLGICKLN